MKHNVGDIVNGTISGIKTYGVFIKFEDTFGFCHISNCSYKFIKNLNELFSIGDEIKVKIINIDNEHNKINVSIKDCEIKEPQMSKKQFVRKSNFEKSKLECKKTNQQDINKRVEVKPTFDDMLKNYLKNSEERLDCIDKRNQKHRKR